MKKVAIDFNGNEWHLVGEIDHTNVMPIFNKSIIEMQKHRKVNIDFSGLTSCSSLGLVMIFEWLKFAKKFQIDLTFKNISKDIIAVAKAARLEHLIP